jgi:hypothetical protein
VGRGEERRGEGRGEQRRGEGIWMELRERVYVLRREGGNEVYTNHEIRSIPASTHFWQTGFHLDTLCFSSGER